LDSYFAVLLFRYDRTKYWPVIPKPKKRAPVTQREDEVDTPVTDPVISSSDVSSSTISSANSFEVFDQVSRVNDKFSFSASLQHNAATIT